VIVHCRNATPDKPRDEADHEDRLANLYRWTREGAELCREGHERWKSSFGRRRFHVRHSGAPS
jgi:hypothetical protein